MTGEIDKDEQDAAALLALGWRQGSAIDPRGGPILIPENVSLGENEFLIVATQSCSVVSPRFKADPNVEFVVARTLGKYNERAPEAKGKFVRKFHIALPAGAAALGIECDLNRRFFFDRRTLSQVKPCEGFSLAEESIPAFAAWIARSYTRIALPDSLVECLRVELLKMLEAALATPFGEVADPLHFEVPFIYISWTPRIENAEIYALKFLFICTGYGAAEVLDGVLHEVWAKYDDKHPHHNIIIEQWDCKVAEETGVSGFLCAGALETFPWRRSLPNAQGKSVRRGGKVGAYFIRSFL